MNENDNGLVSETNPREEGIITALVPEELQGRGVRRLAWVWRFGGAIVVGAVALLGVSLFQQLHGRVENLTSMILKREEFQDFRKAIWDQISKAHERNQARESELKQRCARLEVQTASQEEQERLLAPEIGRLRDALKESLASKRQ